jgi:hypothetical protein
MGMDALVSSGASGNAFLDQSYSSAAPGIATRIDLLAIRPAQPIPSPRRAVLVRNILTTYTNWD